MTRYRTIARPLAGILALSLLALVAPPVSAGETPAGPPSNLAAAAAAKVEAAPAARLAAATQGTIAPGTPSAPGSFFKTRRGAVTLALLAGAIGYMGYSFSHDRVKSPEK